MLNERISDSNTIAGKNFLAKKQSKSYPVMLLYLAQQEDSGETTAAEANDSIFSRAECKTGRATNVKQLTKVFKGKLAAV